MQPSLTNEQDLVEIVLKDNIDTVTINSIEYSDTKHDFNNLRIFKNCTKVSLGYYVPKSGKKYFQPIYGLDTTKKYDDPIFKDIINAIN